MPGSLLRPVLAGLLAMACVCGPLIGAGCSQPSFPKRYPVSGSILVDGKPPPWATIAFIPLNPPEGDHYRASGRSASDGTFKMTTHEMHDGASPGEYAVLLTWSHLVKNVFSDLVPGPDQLHGRYNDPKTSPLKVTVRAEDNVLPPFEFKAGALVSSPK